MENTRYVKVIEAPDVHPGLRHTFCWRDVLQISIAAIMLRGIIFLCVILIHPMSLARYAGLYDGHSYLVTARAMLGDRSEFDEYQGRVFPGFPAMIALMHQLGISIPVAGVGLDWLAAAVAAACSALLFNDRRIGWAMVMLIPHYLMNSSLAHSEAPLLAFTCAGLLVLWRGVDANRRSSFRIIVGGLLLGIAGTIRPMACFAVLGYVLLALRRRHWRESLIVSSCAVTVVLVTLLLIAHWRGDALAGARYYANSKATYDRQLLTWPFHSLVAVTLSGRESPGRIAYIWAHVAVTLAACGAMILVNLQTRATDAHDLLAGPWLLGNTIFVLCVGSIWGFECFHRFTVPALPAMFWAVRSVLPRRWFWWALLGGTSTLLSVTTILRDCGNTF